MNFSARVLFPSNVNEVVSAFLAANYWKYGYVQEPNSSALYRMPNSAKSLKKKDACHMIRQTLLS
jgi:hypothetical protein